MSDDTPDAPELPDIEALEPEQWLSEIDRLHDELLEAVVAVLDEGSELEPTRRVLVELFETYHPNRGEESGDRLVEVVRTSGRLRFGRPDTSKPPVEIEPGDGGEWRASEDSKELDDDHEAIAAAILQLVPWWSERAFVDRVGDPDEFDR